MGDGHDAVGHAQGIRGPGDSLGDGFAVEQSGEESAAALPHGQLRTGAKPVGMTEHADGLDLEAGGFEHVAEGLGREVGEVAGDVEAEPRLSEPVERQAFDVGCGDDEFAAGNEQLSGFAKNGERPVHVFERVPHGDDIESTGSEIGVRKGTDKGIESEFVLDFADGAEGGIEAGNVPALIGHAFEECAAAAAEVEEAAEAVPGKRTAAFIAGPAEETRPQWAMRSGFFHLARPAVGAVIRRVEAADGIRRRPRVGVVKAAVFAADHGEPETGALGGSGVRGFEDEGWCIRTAQRAWRIIPGHKGLRLRFFEQGGSIQHHGHEPEAQTRVRTARRLARVIQLRQLQPGILFYTPA
jgi:hypothetical protein